MRAYYAAGPDYVQMPPFETFRDAESYAAILLHELTHWTKHGKGLARDLGRKRFGDEGYAVEELVAELGAAFLCADLQLTPEVREDHATYIASWITVLKNEKRAIFSAAAHAQRAADYLHSLQPRQTEEERAAAQAAPFPAMALPRFIEIDGRRYLWRDLVALRRAQATPAEQQPTLFTLHDDHRPAGERNAEERYREPSLFTVLERSR
jgi:hypothetical protein